MPVGQGEERVLARDGQIRREQQAHAEPGYRAVNRREHWFGHPAQLVDRLMRGNHARLEATHMRVPVPLQRLMELLDVAAGHEVLATATDHHAAYSRIALERRGDLEQ